MQHLWLFMKDASNAVAAILSNDGIVMRLAMLLNYMTDIAEGDAGLNKFNSLVEAFLSHFDQAFRMVWHFAYTEHLAGIAMETVLNDSDINIDDVPGFQGLAIAGDAVTNHVIN